MPARERMLDAAAQIMRERGIVKATTKEIARTAGCSEALLYKNFSGKHELFEAVLRERLPRTLEGVQPGSGEVIANVERATIGLIGFYREGFPIAAALFGDRDMLGSWRDQAEARGGGPEAPQRELEQYLREEQSLGRLPPAVDPGAIASLLTGAALHEAFLASFADREIDDADALARRWVATFALTI